VAARVPRAGSAHPGAPGLQDTGASVTDLRNPGRYDPRLGGGWRQVHGRAGPIGPHRAEHGQVHRQAARHAEQDRWRSRCAYGTSLP
jgi:hypothetical protein